MSSHALNWLVKQYRCVLGRLRVREYLQNHPPIGLPMANVQCAHRSRRGMLETLENRMMLAVTPHIVTWNEEGPTTITGNNTGTMIPAQNGVGVNPAAGSV